MGSGMWGLPSSSDVWSGIIRAEEYCPLVSKSQMEEVVHVWTLGWLGLLIKDVLPDKWFIVFRKLASTGRGSF